MIKILFLNVVNFDEIPSGSMTEWEREKEREEFARAAQLYRPLSAVMASRFTTAKHSDDTNTVDIKEPVQGVIISMFISIAVWLCL